MPFVSVNPASEKVVAEYPAHTPEQVDQALETASVAFQKWKVASFADRAQLMVRAAELPRVKSRSWAS